MTLLVRPFRRGDLETSFDLWTAAWSTVLPTAEVAELLPGWRRHFVEDLLAEAVVLSAVEAARPDGPAALAGFAVWHAGRRWLDQLIVDPARHRSGVGRLLMATVGRLAEGAETRFRVMKANTAALAFYERLGCRRDGEAVSPTTGWPSWTYVFTPGDVTVSSVPVG